ncbi:MAG: tetratricopeptide repeat protein [Acidobacteriota bacterium]
MKVVVGFLQFALVLSTAFGPRLFGAGNSQQQDLAAHFQAGQQAMRAGNFELAVTEFSKVLRWSPDLAEAQVNLGLAYHLLGNYAESVKMLSQAAQRQPELVPAHLFLGIGRLKLGLHAEAVEPLRRVVRLEPRNREARRALAACHLAEGDYRAAAKEFQELFHLESDKTEAWFQLARHYTEAAGRLARDMALRYRRTSWGHRLAGDLYFHSQRWALAAQEYGEALRVDPSQPGLHAGLGNAYRREKELTKAKAEFENELQRDPKCEEALLGLAEVNLELGELGTARELVDHLWNSSPEFLVVASESHTVGLPAETVQRLLETLRPVNLDVPSHFLLSVLLRSRDEAEKARQHQLRLSQMLQERLSQRPAARLTSPAQACGTRQYTGCAQALSQKPQLEKSEYLLLGKARFVLKELEAAADAFAGMLAVAKDHPEAIYWLARCYQLLGDECFSRLEEMAPDSWRMHQMRAQYYKLSYDDARAILEYQGAVRLRPDVAELHEELAALYLAKNRLDEAQVALDRALRLEPTRAGALYLMGLLYITKREYNSAITYLVKAVQYDTNLLEARAGLGKAYLRAGRPGAAAHELEKALPLDFYGDLHYLLYQAYRDLGKLEPAQAALNKSEEMRGRSVSRDREKLERWMKNY